MLATIGIIIDVAIVLALILFGIIGYKKGFLKSLISLFSWIVCVLIAVFTAKYVAGWINGIHDFSGMIGNVIASKLSDNSDFFKATISSFGGSENIIASIPEGTNGMLKQLIKVVFTNSAVDPTSEATVASVMGDNLGHICMVIISGIIVFVVITVVVKILATFFDNIERTKVLGTLNKIIGCILGILKVACIVVILNFVLVGLSMIPTVNKTITPLVQDNTYIEKVVYNTTDKIFEKQIINGDTIQKWVKSQWEKR